MTLAVDVTKTIAASARSAGFTLEARFASQGGVTALFGRSGAGKTTLVNLIAGLIHPDRGSISLDNRVLADTGQRIDVAAHKRRIGYVFQEGRLFPHMSVRSNLAYGHRRLPRRQRWAGFGQIVDLLGIGPLLDRRPTDLSGGEKQRVAIGRALLASPRLLLMDEPLASLDPERKGEILPYIERLRDEMKLPIVYVSHAVEEVARLADMLVLLDHGKVIATGSVNDVFGRLDLRRFTGQFEAGVVLNAVVLAHDAANGTTVLDHRAGRLSVAAIDKPPGSPVRLRVRARDVALAIGEPGRLSIRNRLHGVVEEIAEGPPPIVEIRLDVGGEPLIARITKDAAKALELNIGQPVVALIKATAFDRLDDLS
jgi:molybdate transport system ATP-binding protein